MPTSMATAPLSRFNYVFSGFYAPCWGSLSQQQVHPSSPVLLTRTSPLDTHNCSSLHVLDCFLPIQSLRMRWHSCCTRSPNHFLYPVDLEGVCWPESHFGGNQLPDSSIGLSPLYPGPAIELNVRTAQDFHQSFPWLRLAQA